MDGFIPDAVLHEARARQWDEWFAATGDEESIQAWTAAHGVITNPLELERWASIIEMNRLTRTIDEKTPAVG